MNNLKVQCFLPCRAGSVRVPHKNTRPFYEKESLFDIKIQQLLRCEHVNSIIFSTDDTLLIKHVENIKSDKIIIDRRPEYYAGDTTTTGELIKYAATKLTGEHVLWTHVTSPFINEVDYSNLIKAYFESLRKGFDSLMTVTKHQKFILDHAGNFNYDREEDAWPRTQTLNAFYEIDSGAFLAPISAYQANSDRIGAKCFLYEQDKIKSLDIDEISDFEICKLIYESKQSKKKRHE